MLFKRAKERIILCAGALAMTIRKAEPIRDIVARVLDNLGLTPRLHEAEAARVFAEVVGERIAARARVMSIRDGIMRVKVSSPTWRQELTFTRQQIVAKVNAALGEAVVKDIYFT